ncbi:MAG: S8 family serine peptidase [Oscillospiraceae bacterium]|nr:S8 family serine peptidase [Oscillospiraceae bacterium]
MKIFTRHLLSMTAAAAISGAAIMNCGFPSAAAEAAYKAAESGKLVPVIVRLSGEAVLAGEAAAQLGTDYLDTADAEIKAAALRQISSEAEAALRSLYPDLEIGYRYDLLMNGFSCELPAGLLNEARSCPWVEGISKVETLNIPKPELYTAPELSEVDYFGETTGYFGEGEVIAVLDSEFDITHSMFAAIDDRENKLTKDDIAAVAGDLNVEIDPDKAYISSKLPYVIDYSDDTPYEYSAPEGYHGTHVAGIAAGDMFSDADGTEISGIAKDAQIVMMKVFDHILIDEENGAYMQSLDSDRLLAALEDAAKLKADVINLSLGSPNPDLDSLPYKDTLTALNNAGIIVVASAGNYSNNLIEEGVYLDMDPSVPDTHTVIEPSSCRDVLCVASANNSFRQEPCFLIEGLDDEIPFCEAENCTLSDFLSDGVYEYVYCGLGAPEDFEGKDVEGKIALIDRGEYDFIVKAINAAEAGAVAMIVCNNIEEDMLTTMILDYVIFPSVFISMNNGIKMKEAESGKIRLDSTISVVTPLDGGISEFSSFGPAADLTLKPDIAGIGGSVTSAAYDNKLKQLDGTSMASPYVAGCAAVLSQYLRKNGLELAGAEKTAFIKNLMMNSAVLFTNGDVYESPRRQGAGLVNMKNVLNDRVILTGEGGLAKVELKDKITDQLSFDVDIRNFTDQDVAFTDAKLVLTAEDSALTGDDEFGIQVISGAGNISVTADLSALLEAKAQMTKTVTVNVQLSADELAAHSVNFPNGFFVEGYIILSGAENCCDISIPVMGFYGDWAQVPIFRNGTMYSPPYTVYSESGDGAFDASVSFAGNLEALSQLLERLPAEAIAEISADPFSLSMYYDDEYWDALAKYSGDDLHLSPDGDGMAERLEFNYTVMRSAHVSGLKLYDSDNKLVIDESEDDAVMLAYAFGGYFSEADFKNLPEGTYRGVIEGYIYYEGAKENPQTYEFPIVIDKTAPELKIKPKEENGRKLLEITSSDQSLDGIYIMGKGNGGIAGEYTAESPQLAEMNNIRCIVESVYSPHDMWPDELRNPVSSDLLTVNTIMGTADKYEQNITDAYTFSDILPAYRYQDEDGSISVTYDVTDLDEYVVAAIDKAFNTTEILSDGRDTSHLKTGLWWAQNNGDDDVYYNFWDTEAGNIRYQNGAPEIFFSFEQNGDTVTMVTDEEPSGVKRTGKISFTDHRNAVITWDDGKTEKLFYANPDGFGGFDYVTTSEMKAIVTAYHNTHSTVKAVSAEASYDENGMGIVRLLDQNGKQIAEYTGFDRFENTAIDPSGKPVQFEYIRPGVYNVFQNPEQDTKHYYILFKEDGTAALCSAENGPEREWTVEYGDNVITCNKGKADEFSANVTYAELSWLTVTLKDGREYQLTFEPNFTADNFKVYTTSELEKMAADYCEHAYGKRLALVSASFDDSGFYVMQFSEGRMISAGPLGAFALDQYQNAIDLIYFPEICDGFEKGLWFCKNGESLKYYSSDGNGNFTVKDAADGSEETIKYRWIGTMAVEFSHGDQTETADAIAISAPDYERAIELHRADNQIDVLVYAGEETLDSINFYTDQELVDMAAADRSKRAGKTVKVSETVANEDGTVTISFDDGSAYKIDRFTGKGTDGNGRAINLPQTGNNNLSSAAAAAAAGMLIIFGAAAVYASGAFRRKEDC